MNIEFDKQEYRDLLDIVHIADVVLSGHGRAADAQSARHRALIQKLYSLAKSAGFEGMMDFNVNERKYVPTREFEENTLAHVELNAFGDHLFWEHLVNRLAQRDAALLVGGLDRLAGLGEQDRHKLYHAIRQRYAAEFQANDIVNLKVVEPLAAAAPGMPVKTSD